MIRRQVSQGPGAKVPGRGHETAAKSFWSKLLRPVALDGGKHQTAGGPVSAGHCKQLTEDVIRGLFFFFFFLTTY